MEPQQQLGTAAWADPASVEKDCAWGTGRIWLGRSAEGSPLGHEDDRHVCVVSGSRGGKGTSNIIPTLLTWPGSVVVVDPKGENTTVTADRRGKGSENVEGMGQAVYVVDPFEVAMVEDRYRARFNPLDALDPNSDEVIGEAGRIANALVIVQEDSKDPFWDQSARKMVKGLILHILTAPQYEGRRNLVTLRSLLLRGDWEAVDELRKAGEDTFSAQAMLWQGVSMNPAFGGLVSGIGENFASMLANTPKVFDSVRETADQNTEFMDEPPMQRVLAGSDFKLADLKTRGAGVSLYLCLPQRYMPTHYRWLRMMISLTITEMEKTPWPVPGPASMLLRVALPGHYSHAPVLMILDEFAGLKRMEVIENAVAQIAGYGVKLFFVVQSLEQLKAVYKDNWETFLANCGLKVFFNIEDNFSREYVSKQIGETELMRETKSASDMHGENESRSQTIALGSSHSLTKGISAGTSYSSGTSSGTSSGATFDPAVFGLFGGRIRSVNSGCSSGTFSSSGTSTGSSSSIAEGTTRSESGGSSEGKSSSRTEGKSETVHRRPLISPDEIGYYFARVDESHSAWPGLALVLVAGRRPTAVRRVNYFEDYQFIGLFDPHPDHTPPRFTRQQISNAYVMALLKYHMNRFREGQAHLLSWEQGVNVGCTVAKGQKLLEVPVGTGRTGEYLIADIFAPQTGQIVDRADAIDGDSLLTIRYKEGEPCVNPFSQFDVFVSEAEWAKRIRAAKIEEATPVIHFSVPMWIEAPRKDGLWTRLRRWLREAAGIEEFREWLGRSF